MLFSILYLTLFLETLGDSKVTDYGPCHFDGEDGRCVDYRTCTGETTTQNLCPGGNEIQCCVPRVGLINVPLRCQLPELKNGCEVTSLSMLLGWGGKQVDKMTLAAQVAKDPTPYKDVNGQIYWGNPNRGFVGDITGKTMGYSVYHGPVLNLARQYHAAINVTGQPFSQVLQNLNQGKPVWVITSFSFEPVPPSQWKTVISPIGEYRLSFNEHSVVLTGYTAGSVWINDPYGCVQNKKLARKPFEQAWEQFGRQAIVLQ